MMLLPMFNGLAKRRQASRRKLHEAFEEETNPTDGVFVVTTETCKSSKTVETASSSASGLTKSLSWRSSATKEHRQNTPLIVSSPDEPEKEIEDEEEALNQVMLRSKRLPTTSHYASNHIMVNEERKKRRVSPLTRLRELDAIARAHAEKMAAEAAVFHSEPSEIQEAFNRSSRRFGENVKRGYSIRSIHDQMTCTEADLVNIVDSRYTHMGMATAKGADGRLYLCQVFRG